MTTAAILGLLAKTGKSTGGSACYEVTIAVVIAVLSSRRASQSRGRIKKPDEQCVVVFVEREELEEDSANTWTEWMVFEVLCAGWW